MERGERGERGGKKEERKVTTGSSPTHAATPLPLSRPLPLALVLSTDWEESGGGCAVCMANGQAVFFFLFNQWCSVFSEGWKLVSFTRCKNRGGRISKSLTRFFICQKKIWVINWFALYYLAACENDEEKRHGSAVCSSISPKSLLDPTSCFYLLVVNATGKDSRLCVRVHTCMHRRLSAALWSWRLILTNYHSIWKTELAAAPSGRAHCSLLHRLVDESLATLIKFIRFLLLTQSLTDSTAATTTDEKSRARISFINSKTYNF